MVLVAVGVKAILLMSETRPLASPLDMIPFQNVSPLVISLPADKERIGGDACRQVTDDGERGMAS